MLVLYCFHDRDTESSLGLINCLAIMLGSKKCCCLSLAFSCQPAAGISSASDAYWQHGAPSSQIHITSPMQPQSQKPLDPKTSYDSFLDQQKAAYSQGHNLQYPATHQVPQSYQSPANQQVPQSYQSPAQIVPSSDTRRVSKLQIPTNPRIASNLTFGLPKTDKDSSTAGAAVKPAYISVSQPKANEKVSSNDAADSMLKVRLLLCFTDAFSIMLSVELLQDQL